MGRNWERAQDAALGLDGTPFREGCAAALRLYALAAREVEHLFDDRQKRVVDHARRLVERWAG